MICGLDRVILGAASPGEAAKNYATLFGRAGIQRDPAICQLSNARLHIVDDVLEGRGLLGLAFVVRDLERCQRLLNRRGLNVRARPEALPGGPAALVVDTGASHGVRMEFLEPRKQDPDAAGAAQSDISAADAVSGLDHVVIRTPSPERSIALYAGRLGLSLRLDMSNSDWGMRLLFFRCGDLIVELAHNIGGGEGEGPDRLWGLSWRVPDVQASHARLRAAGVDISDIRAGRRPGTHVFSVRSHTAGVPTLMIGPAIIEWG